MAKKRTKKELNAIFAEIVGDKGVMRRTFVEEDHNKYFITGLQAGNADATRYVGRIAQVRLEAGAWGSDIVFLRHYDSKLWTHENQAFYQVREKYIPILDEIFKGATKDQMGDTYTTSVGSNDEETGFIIPSKIKEGETTPMRDVRAKIKQQLFG